MQRSQRIGLLVAAAIVAVAAVVLLSSGGDDDDSSDSDKTAQTTTTGGTTTTDTGSAKPEQPPITTITIKGGQAVGGEQEIEADRGDTVQFRVKSDEDHEIHLHGYDIAKDVEAGGQVGYKFTADIDGLFEIEIEDLGQPIAELRVNP